MGAMPNEPSMEEILSSIKRIIAEEDRAVPRVPKRTSAVDRVNEAGRVARSSADDHILELTDVIPDEPAGPGDTAPIISARAAPRAEARTEARGAKSEPRPEARRARDSAAPAATPARVLSDTTASAARDSLDHLSKLLVRSEDGQSNTVEGLVREMLRPMLKEWLDARLPDLVEGLVKREIDRITGRV